MNNSLFKPNHLKQLCNQYGLQPSKRYGQNFLISKSPIDAMIKAADLNKNDTVVEIGPGFGVLTFAVAPLVKKVVAFEIERKLQDYWDQRLRDCLPAEEEGKIKRLENDCGDIEIVWGNALTNLKSKIINLKSYKVLANLPYQITSKVLRTLLEAENRPERIIVMVQKEVAERIVAKPPQMSLLAVSVQYYGEPKIITKVPRGSFWPRPAVDSAIVKITLPPYHLTTQPQEEIRNEEIKKCDESFFKVVRAGFASKRKQVWRNLSVGLGLDGGKVKEALRKVVGNEKARAQELSVRQWEKVTQSLYHLITQSPTNEES